MQTVSRLIVLAALVAAGIGGYWAGQRNLALPGMELLKTALLQEAPASPIASGPTIYYRHPDGNPLYAAGPRNTDDGRPFIAIHASEDISFDPLSETEPVVATGETGKRRILYYRNPMGLPDTSPMPKKDSMGMDYIPVYEGEQSDNAGVTLTTGKVQRTGVKTALVQRVAVQRPVRVPAAIQLDERRISVISTRTDAFIEEVADITTGQSIQEGAPMMQIFAREIATAGADFVSNLRSGGQTDGAVQRLRNLGVPSSAIEEIRKTGKVPLRITLTAPRSGVVIERSVASGMMAAPGQMLFRIGDTSTVWAIADVPEYALESLRIGAPTVIRIRSLPGQEFSGKLDLIYPEIESQTRTAKVRIELPNPDGLLMANMYAEADITTGASEPVIAVADSAVIDTGDRQLVFVDKGKGRFEPRDVQLGVRGEGMTEIRKGLSEGERVVVAANFLIDAESNLKAALSALTPAEVKP